MSEQRRRQVRSFVRRAGRMTAAQSRAIAELWPRYGIEPPRGRLDLDALFGRHARHVAEIGFGNGDALAEMAARHPDTDFLGIEVHEPGVGHLLLTLEKQDLPNVRVACQDAMEVLRDWGVHGEPRTEPLPTGERIAPDELDIGVYERERPA